MIVVEGITISRALQPESRVLVFLVVFNLLDIISPEMLG